MADIIATSGLAVRVSIAYKNTPDGCRHISEEAAALQVLIERGTSHFKGTTISSEDRLKAQKVLKSCQSVLQDLYSLLEKYNRLASINMRLVLKGVKVSNQDIITLQSRLISETVLLNGFIRRFVNPSMHSTYQFYEY